MKRIKKVFVCEQYATVVVAVGIVCSTLRATVFSSLFQWHTVLLIMMSCAAAILLSFVVDGLSPAAIYRKNAANGVLDCLLLPVSLLMVKHGSSLLTVFSFASAILSLATISCIVIPSRSTSMWTSAGVVLLIMSAVCVSLFAVHFQGLMLLCLALAAQLVIHQQLPVWLPRSFTVGEAAIVAQSIVTFLELSAQHFVMSFELVLTSRELPVADQELLFIETAVISCALVVLSLSVCRYFRSTMSYYMLVLLVAIFFSLPTLGVLFQRDFVSWLIWYIYSHRTKAALFTYWTLWSIMLSAIVYVNAIASKKVTEPDTDSTIKSHCRLSEGISTATNGHSATENKLSTSNPVCPKSSTIVRKQFHVAAVAIFIPGLIFDVCVLRMAATCSFVVLVMCETLRVICIPPLGDVLHHCFKVFVDDRDEGKIITTHLYLLIGCSCPLWLDTGNKTSLAHFSGILSLGIGDTMASVVGSLFGHHKWPHTEKTLEGSSAAFISQIAFIYCLQAANVAVADWLYVCFSVMLVSLLEALTTQIDNLILPLFTFLLLRGV